MKPASELCETTLLFVNQSFVSRGSLTSAPGGTSKQYNASSSCYLVIPQKSARPREAGVLDACAPQILRCAQDDSQGCHPERSEGSVADLEVITSCYLLTGQD